MLTLRLQRAGKKNKPEFRIVLAEKTAAAGKKFVEVLGNYNPHTKQLGLKSEDRLKYWVSQHVEISPTLHNLLVTKNLISAPKQKAYSVPKKPQEETAAEAAPAAVAETASADVAAAPEAAAETAEAPAEEESAQA